MIQKIPVQRVGRTCRYDAVPAAERTDSGCVVGTIPVQSDPLIDII